MKTYILFWNPAISSCTMADYQEKLAEIEYGSLNWSVYEHEAVSCGDRCFMVRCGEGGTGICMSGYFGTDPLKDEDWADESKERYYVEIDSDVMINPVIGTILSTDELCREIPEFDWTGDHSDRVLEAPLAEKLEALWTKFQDEHQELFMQRAVKTDIIIPSYYSSVNDDKQTITVRLNENGTIRGYCESFDIETTGKDIDTVMKKMGNLIYKKSGKKPELQMKYGWIEEKYEDLYGKVVKLVIDNKKKGDTFYDYFDTPEKLVRWIETVGVSADKLKELDFPENIVKAIKALTRKADEPLVKYAKRAAKNSIARSIVLSRIENALRIKHLKHIDEEKLKILNENLEALHSLGKVVDDFD